MAAVAQKNAPGAFVLRMAATEDVSTTRLTLSLCFTTLLITLVVPCAVHCAALSSWREQLPRGYTTDSTATG